jgi:hypothetical protein
MLQALQAAAAANEHRTDGEIPWRDDGSIAHRARGVDAGCGTVDGHAIALDARPIACSWWSRLEPRSDAALSRPWTQPLLGSSKASAFRPTLQLLPLVMRLVWEPLDFKALMQFLTHPVGPIRSFARRTLAEKMASGSRNRRRGLASSHASNRIPLPTEGAAVRADIQFWLENPRFTAAEQVPIEFIAARVARLAQFFRNGMANQDALRRAAWAAGYQQATALDQALQTLQQQGVQRIGPEGARPIGQSGDGFGCDNPLLRAEARACCCVARRAQ